MKTVGRSSLALLVVMVVAILVVILIAPVSPLVTKDAEEKAAADVQFIRPVNNGSTQLWPYTSRGPSFGQATLPINIVVHDDVATVYRLLAFNPSRDQILYWDTTSEKWTAGDPGEANVTINGTGVHWGESEGSDRYIFTMTNDSGTWAPETYQVHDGTYFGSRYHLRLYQGGSGDHTWTAIQAHHEYWDWFYLRHDVNSLVRAQHVVERDFLGTGLVTEMRRERWGSGDVTDEGGWMTVIELRERVSLGPRASTARSLSTHGMLVIPLIGLAVTAYLERLHSAGRESLEELLQGRVSPSSVALFASTAILPLSVRVGAVAIERGSPWTAPAVIGGPFYLLLVVGLPVSALVFGRRLSMTEGFTISVLGMGTGIMADFAYLGLAAIPYGTLVHRLVLLFGLGLIAAGGTRWSPDPMPRHRYHIVGIGIWIGALLWPLLGGG